MNQKGDIKKILVVCLDNIGDAVMATAILKPLKRLYPHSTVGIWVKNYAADLFWDQSLIDHVHASDPFWDKAPGRGNGSFRRFFTTALEVRRQKYDAAFLLNTEWRRASLAAVLGIPFRIGFHRRRSKLFLTHAFPPSPGIRHFVEDHLDLLSHWSGDSLNLQENLPRLELNYEEKEWWLKWSKQTGWKEKQYIVVHPFTGDDRKTWPLACWADLLLALISGWKNFRCLILAGSGEHDRLQQLISNLPGECVRVASAGSLSQLKTLVGHSQLLVGGDSGPGHVAAALGIPVVSLFGSSNPARSRPLGYAPVTVLHNNPIKDLSVSEVEKAVRLSMEEKTAHV